MQPLGTLFPDTLTGCQQAANVLFDSQLILRLSTALREGRMKSFVRLHGDRMEFNVRSTLVAGLARTRLIESQLPFRRRN
jgi:hypothetical protein